MSLIRHPEPVPNDRQTLTLAEDEHWWYELMRMGFNHRLVMTPKANPWGGWDYGWCFHSALAVTAAMAVWEPMYEDEPVGWHKRPTYDKVRRAPRRDERLEANAARCVHGTVVARRECDDDCEARPRPAREISPTDSSV